MDFLKTHIIEPCAPPALSARTLSMPFNGSIGAGTFSRSTNSWHPETGVICQNNTFLNSATGVTQNITAAAAPSSGQIYAGQSCHLSFKGTGSIAISGTGTGTLAGTGATDRVTLNFTPTAGTVTFTVTGTCTEVSVGTGPYQSYLVTTAAANYNSPRYVSGGILVEEASTNVRTYSNSLSQASVWTVSSANPTQNATNCWGAANSAWTITDNSAVALQYVGATFVTLTAVPYTYSCYIKKTTATQTIFPAIGMNNGTLMAVAVIDTTTGETFTLSSYPSFTMASGMSASAISVGDFWRLSLTFTGTASNWTTNLVPAGRDATNKTSGAEINSLQGSVIAHDFQLEALPYATSPIVTGASSVQRGAETLTYPTTGIFATNGSAGTVAEWVLIDPVKQAAASTNVHTFFHHRDAGGTDQLISLQTYPANTPYAVLKTTAQKISGGALTAGWHHLCMTWDSTFFRYYIDSVLVSGSIATPTVPTTLSATFGIGNNGGSQQAAQPLDTLFTYNRALTQAEVTQLYRSGRK